MRSDLKKSVIVLLSLISFSSVNAVEWTTDGSGNWNDNANWDAAFPNAAGAAASFNLALSNPITVTLQQEITIGSLNFNGAMLDQNVTITDGSNSLIFDNGGSDATLSSSGATSNVISSAVTLSSNLSITSSSTLLSINGVVSGSGNVTKAGAGALVLGAANTYTGSTTINAGTIRATIANSLPTTTALSFANTSGAIFDLNGFNQTVGSIAGGGGSGGDVTLGGATLTFGDANSTSYSGTISEAGALIKQGSGVTTFTTSQTYTGSLTINAGTFRLGGNDVVSESVVMADVSGAIFDLNDFNDTITALSGGGSNGGNVDLGSGTLTVSSSSTYAGVISGTGALTKSSTGTLTLTGTNTYTGATSVTGGTLSVTGSILTSSGVTVSSGGTVSIPTVSIDTYLPSTRTIQSGGTLNLSLSSTSTLSSDIIPGAAGNLSKSGAGSLTISSAQTFTGSLIVSVGTVSLSSAGLLSASAVSISSGAILSLSNSETFTSVSGAGNVAISSGTFTLNNSSELSLGGVNGAGNFTKTGAAL